MSVLTSNSERRLRLLLEYDGTGLVGWQRQHNGVSVQGMLEEAVAGMVGRPTTVVGASRTDAGVHATGQVASFVTDAQIPDDGFRRGLNNVLAPQVSVVEVKQVPLEFHPRHDSKGKRYRYRLLCRSSPAPLERLFSWQRPMPLRIDDMRRAAEVLIGEQDFAAFRGQGCQAKTTMRNIKRVDILADEHRVAIDVYGNAFLRNMVRIIAGTLVDIGEGRMPVDVFKTMLDTRDRTLGGQTAPPHGLTLCEVLY